MPPLAHIPLLRVLSHCCRWSFACCYRRGSARFLRNSSYRHRRELACLSLDLPRRGDSSFVESALLRQSVHRKTKISPFLQLFCDYGFFSVPLTRKLAAVQPIICAFALRSAIGGVHNNPQSQKSCNPSRFSVFSLSEKGSRVCASLVQLVNVCRAHLALC